ncbi:MAG: aminotransferase class I/II-fold pyridoxal phosphate-dependent enzyme [Gammaproteobacteria bacterium]|nr:aminotransferase class I/II-fold pyridoxal phosphate-dependent enzyme [Gammaproteobacteria bacterium]
MRTFALEAYFSQWEFTAKHNMTASDVQSMTIEDLLRHASDDDRRAYETAWLGYSQTWGMPELRDQIAGTYDTLSAENILCFAGAEEGIYAAMRVMLTAKDHAIVVVPNYQAAETIPLDICDVTGVGLDEQNDWRLDLNKVEAAFRDNTSLVSINFPNNPTGALMPREDLQELISLCRHHDCYLFSDEVYRQLERREEWRLPQVADEYEKGLSLNVLSKAYGLPGLRIGWVAGKDTGLLQRMERYKHYLSICNTVPGERLALIALKARDAILSRNRALIAANLVKLNAFFDDYAEMFDWSEPRGGCIGFPRYKGTPAVDEFCESLVKDEGVLLLPASLYRSELMATPPDRFRIGFGRANIDEGLQAFRHYLDRHAGEHAA